jgi:cytochrome oxidase assembly protein ShyY1
LSIISTVRIFLLQLIPATTFGLGTWQVHRHKWKQQLIADMKARNSAAPCDLPHEYEAIMKKAACI